MGRGSKGGRRDSVLTIDNNGYKPRVNDLVFACVKSFPPWPAIVRHRDHEDADTLKSELKNPNKHFVQFYGTYEIAVVHQNDLYPFKEFKEKFGNPKKKTKKFVTAMSEIESDDPLFIIRKDEPADEDEEQMEIDDNAVGSPAPAEDALDTPKLTKPKSSKKKKPASKIDEAVKSEPSTVAPESENDPDFQPVPFWKDQSESIDTEGEEHSLLIDEGAPEDDKPDRKVSKKKKSETPVPKLKKPSTALQTPQTASSKKRKAPKNEKSANAPSAKKPKGSAMKIKIGNVAKSSGGSRVKSETINQEEKLYIPGQDDMHAGPNSSKKNSPKSDAQLDNDEDEDNEQPAEVSVEINEHDINSQHELNDPSFPGEEEEEDEDMAEEQGGDTLLEDANSNTQVQALNDASLDSANSKSDNKGLDATTATNDEPSNPVEKLTSSTNTPDEQPAAAPVTSPKQDASVEKSSQEAIDDTDKSLKETAEAKVEPKPDSADQAPPEQEPAPSLQNETTVEESDKSAGKTLTTQHEIDLNDEKIRAKIEEKTKQKEEAKRRKKEEKLKKKQLERQKSSEKDAASRENHTSNNKSNKKQPEQGSGDGANKTLQSSSQKSKSSAQKQPKQAPSMFKQLQSINEEICASLPQKGRQNHDRAIKALQRLACLNPHPTAQELLDCKDLLMTIKKLKKYKHSEIIKNKSIHLFDKFKKLFDMAPLCEEDARELLKPPKEIPVAPVSSENLPVNRPTTHIEKVSMNEEVKKKPEVHYMHLQEAMAMDAVNDEHESGDLDSGVACVDDGPPSEQDGLSIVKQVSDSPPQLFIPPTEAEADAEADEASEANPSSEL